MEIVELFFFFLSLEIVERTISGLKPLFDDNATTKAKRENKTLLYGKTMLWMRYLGL